MFDNDEWMIYTNGWLGLNKQNIACKYCKISWLTMVQYLHITIDITDITTLF